MAAIPRLFNNNAILSVGAKMKNILYDTDNYLIFSFNDVDTDVSATSSDGFFFSSLFSLKFTWMIWLKSMFKQNGS